MSQITFKKVGLDNVNILQNLAIETFRQTFSHDNSEEQLQAFFNESYTLPVLKSELPMLNLILILFILIQI